MPGFLVGNAAALLIGNELLSGKVQETNLLELAKTLRTLGVRLQRVVLLPDDKHKLVQELRQLSAAFDLVFTSGGVGPTHDDLTIEAVAQAFETDVISHPALEQLIRNTHSQRCTPAHLRMALVPKGAELYSAPNVAWPATVMRNVWILPGVPEIFRIKLEIVRTWVLGRTVFVSRAALTRVEEPLLKPLLDRVVAHHPEVEVGSYPKWRDPDYATKITFDGQAENLVEAALNEFLGGLSPEELVRVE